MSSDFFDAVADLAPPRPAREDPGSPLWMLILAGTALIGSAVTFVFGAGVPANAIGYALASLIAFTFVALFRRASVKRFVAAGIPSTRLADATAVTMLVLGLLLAALHAYRIARHYG